jgi:hypothetical protein
MSGAHVEMKRYRTGSTVTVACEETMLLTAEVGVEAAGTKPRFFTFKHPHTCTYGILLPSATQVVQNFNFSLHSQPT